MTEHKRIIVTGASGFLGRQVADTFVAAGHEVVRQGFRNTEGVTPCDLREKDAVAQLVEGCNPDWIIHCAAYREPDFCEIHETEARRLNVEATAHLLAALPPHGRMLFVSTDYVFDGTQPPYLATDPVCPVNLYGSQKVESEGLVSANPKNLIVRIPVLVGPDPVGVKGFLTQMIEELRSGIPHVVDHVLVRCPTHIADVAKAFHFLVSQGASGIWHASAPFAGTRYALTLEVGRLLGLSSAHLQPSDETIPRAARRPINASLESSALRQAGFSGMRGLPEYLTA